MAKIKLFDEECENDLLPNVCMVCGERATTLVKRKFQWHPPWIAVLILAGLLVYVIVALIMTKRMTVNIPLCDQHRNHWSKRALWTWLTLVFVVIFGAAGIGVYSSLPLQDQQGFGGFICLACVLVALAWLILAVVLQSTAIKANEITDNSITLLKVHPEFIDALKEDRARDLEEDEDDDDDRYRQKRR